ncbi:MAG: carboxylesterase/lipase family protein [Phenylobacterium sp.]|uniref:carboxylesterase/lipase family protein n=1 Tax=Phenylobacterium sp. TaxID=1871053 RepID=UPI003BB55E52
MSQAATLDATVKTNVGWVEGLTRGRHMAFYGIPYAAAPTGQTRFRAPKPAGAWAGVRKATEKGYAALQTAHFIPGFAASGAQDEDCLNLNVFTPAIDSGKRPVMVWIHGGGFTHGAGYEPLYDGGPLAERGDLVVVSLNYRLGALGFLSIPEAGSPGNAGLLDQVAALKWVADNIAAFGGDPDQVTIFGESAGSAAVSCLVAMPSARGLFKRAILQSGVGRAGAPEIAAKAADKLLAGLGLDRSQVVDLFDMPAAKILEAQASGGFGPGAGFGPTRDPASLPEAPMKVVRDGGAGDIALLIGSNRDEVKLFVPGRREPMTDEALLAAVRGRLPKPSEDQARDLIDVYRASRETKGLPADNLDILDAIGSDMQFHIASIKFAAAQAPHSPAWLYLFTHVSPARRGALGAGHALEMPFVFGTTRIEGQVNFAGAGPDVERLEGEIMDAWIAFARTGNPNHPGLPAWPAYDAGTQETMVFDTVAATVQSDPFGEARRALEALL